MNGLPFNDIDYCKYGMPYRKRTRLWNNIDCWRPRPLCKRDCDNMNANRKRHKETAQRAPPSSREELQELQTTEIVDLYKLGGNPEPLITEIVASMGDNNISNPMIYTDGCNKVGS